MTIPTPYQQRALDQMDAWVNGRSEHNTVDDECCPDFSCCHPTCFEPDREKRAMERIRYRHQQGFPSRSDA